MGGDAGGFGDKGRVDIEDGKTLFGNQPGDLPQEFLGIDVAERLVGGRKVMADVLKPRRAQQSVTNGVGQAVRVGMPEQSPVVRNFDAPEDEAPVLGEDVEVVTMANT